MAGSWFAGLGQTIAGGIATVATLGQVEAVNDWTADGAKRLVDSSEECWGKDGQVTKFCESVPVLGYVASAGHAIAGDEQRARRAAASSSKTTLVAVGGTVGLLGGPAGAAAGAGLGNIAGQCAERGINHAIDEEFQTDAGTFDDFDVEEFGKDLVFDTALGGLGSATGGAIKTAGKEASRAVVGASLKEGGKVVTKNAGRYVVKRGVEQAVKQGSKAAQKNMLKQVIYK